MTRTVLTGTVLDERVQYSLKEVCGVCGSQVEWVVELVEYGILQPTGDDKRHWQFPGSSLHTALKARRLQQDLKLNLPGVALALELLDEIETLRARLDTLDLNDE